MIVQSMFECMISSFKRMDIMFKTRNIQTRFSFNAQLLHFRPGVVVEEPDCPVGDDKEDGDERQDTVGHQGAQHQRPPLRKWEKERMVCSPFFCSKGSGRDVGVNSDD